MNREALVQNKQQQQRVMWQTNYINDFTECKYTELYN